jgi:aminomethyltransferase
MDVLPTNRRTPLYQEHVAAGARMVPFAGWEMPIQYQGLKAEHHTVRTAVGLFDVSHMGEVMVYGPSALDALQSMTTNDVSQLSDGGAQYTVIANERGGVVDDVVVCRFSAEHFMVCVNAANRKKDFDWLVAHNTFGDAARIEDASDLWGQVAIQGRFAVSTLAKLTEIDVASLTYYHLTTGTVAGISDCIVARTGYTGEDGFEVFAPADQTVALWRALMAAGEEFGISPIGLGARDTLRLEARYCLYGHELNDDTSPLAAGLGWVTKLNKDADFVGKQALLAGKGKATHRLVGIVIEGKRIAREEMSVLSEGQEIGFVTSGTRSPTLNQGICLAYVGRDYTRPGTKVVIDVRGRAATGMVVKGSFYQRDYE